MGIFRGLYKRLKRWRNLWRAVLMQWGVVKNHGPYKVNLGSGARYLSGYWNIDIGYGCDLVIDLEKQLLPFADNSMQAVVCISVINYFSRSRAEEIIQDVHRVLKPGGVARFGTQDLRLIAQKYLEKDLDFFSQKLPDGRERFEGKTMGDKFNSWFYGYGSGFGKHCKQVYDYESLAEIFHQAGFGQVERREFRDSRLADVKFIDNRPEQMFFLEAIK